jgi:hypothetical protein
LTNRRSILTNSVLCALASIVLLTVYVLSYAPVVRYVKARQPPDPYRLCVADGRDLPLYAPVDWFIDKTPLETPLMHWAELWGVEGDFALAQLLRKGCIPYIDPPWYQPSR